MNGTPGLGKAGRLQLAALLCSLPVTGMGVIVLLGWAVDMPILTTFGSGKIPMAPSTALFFFLSGLAVPVFARLSSVHRAGQRLIAAATAAATLIALLLMVLSSLGIRSHAEYLGMEISGAVQGAPIGHMSPLTALCFVLAGVSFLAGSLAGRRYGWPKVTAAVSATLIVLIAFALLLAYLLGSPLLYGSGVIPPALTTSLAFFFLGLSLQFAAWLRAGMELPADSRAAWAFGLIFLLLSAGIITGGFFSYRKYEREYRHAVEQQLVAVAELKSVRVTDWLDGQRAYFAELAANRGFVQRLRQWLDLGTKSEGEIVMARLMDQIAGREYDGVALLAPGGDRLFGAGEPVTPSDMPAAFAARSRDGGEVTHSDLFRDTAGKIRLFWAVPFRTPEDNRLLATAFFAVDPERFLFPFLRVWPVPSRTAETLLVRRDGDHVLFLNQLKFRTDAALQLRIPLTATEVPAVRAVLGREGIVEGTDYRGEWVVAALRALSGTDWFLVARLDTAEMYAPVRERLWLMVFFLLALLVGAGMALLFFWVRLLHAHRFELLRAAAEKDRLYAGTLEQQVAERTAALAEVNRGMDAFVYTVSHDLKAPLRGIDGYSRLLLEDHASSLNEEGRVFLANVRQGVLQMGELIDDLLAYSRAERRPLQSDPVDVAAVIRAVSSERQEEISARGVTLHVDLPTCIIPADADGLLLALRNLLDNALKFTAAVPAPQIDIRGRCHGEMCLLTVRDNGVGFDMKYHDRIFEIFQRLHRVEEYPGTGIGLAIVRKAVERMGGRVWAESAPGQGATFYLELPR